MLCFKSHQEISFLKRHLLPFPSFQICMLLERRECKYQPARHKFSYEMEYIFEFICGCKGSTTCSIQNGLLLVPLVGQPVNSLQLIISQHVVVLVNWRCAQWPPVVWARPWLRLRTTEQWRLYSANNNNEYFKLPESKSACTSWHNLACFAQHVQ